MYSNFTDAEIYNISYVWIEFGTGGHSGSTTFETKSSYCLVARQGLPCYTERSSTTWFQTSRYCRAKVEFNSINWVQHVLPIFISKKSQSIMEPGAHNWKRATPTLSVGTYITDRFNTLL